MKIGFDLDNTIVDYSQAVLEYACTLDSCQAKTVSELKRWFFARNQEDQWTRAQSWLYSEGLKFAEITKGALDVLTALNTLPLDFSILSHKTVLGPKEYGGREFRKAMNEWLFYSDLRELCMHRVEYFDTLDAKVEAICKGRFGFFIDDLRKVLEHDDFPQSTIPIHYSPDLHESDYESKSRIVSIQKLSTLLTFFAS